LYTAVLWAYWCLREKRGGVLLGGISLLESLKALPPLHYITRPKELNGSAVVVTTKLFARSNGYESGVHALSPACSLVKAQLKGFDFTPQVQSWRRPTRRLIRHTGGKREFSKQRQKMRKSKGPKSLGGESRIWCGAFFVRLEGVNFQLLPSFT